MAPQSLMLIDSDTCVRPKPSREEAMPEVRWSLVVAVNDDTVLSRTLLASPALDSDCQIIVKRQSETAGSAYNAGLQEAAHEIVAFAHQDVYLPKTWKHDLQRCLEKLAV